MKKERQILAYLLAALMAVAQLCNFQPSGDFIAGTSHGQQDVTLSPDTGKLVQYAISGQPESSRSIQFQLKLPAAFSPATLVRVTCFTNAVYQSENAYYQWSKLLIPGLRLSDIIFPFHTFW